MFICGILSVFLFNKILNKIFQSAVIKIASLICFGSSLSLIWYSCCTKPYIYDVFVTLLLLNFTYSLKNISEISWKKIWLYILGACFFIYSSLPSIVIIQLYWGIYFLKNIFVKNFENIKKLILFQLIVFSTIIVECFTYFLKMATDSHLKGQWLENCFFFAPNSLDAINAIFREIFYDRVFFDNEVLYHYSNNIIILITLIFFTGTVCFVQQFFKSDTNLQERIKGFFVITPVYFFMLLGFLNIYPFCNRAILFLYPIFILILFKPFDFKKGILINSVRNIFLIGIIIFYLFDIYKQNSNLTDIVFGRDWYLQEVKASMKFLQKAEDDDKFIILSYPNEDMPFCFIATNKKDLTKYRAYYFDYICNNKIFFNEIFTKTKYEVLDFNNFVKDKDKIILFIDEENTQKEKDLKKLIEEEFELKRSYRILFSYYERKKRDNNNEKN